MLLVALHSELQPGTHRHTSSLRYLDCGASVGSCRFSGRLSKGGIFGISTGLGSAGAFGVRGRLTVSGRGARRGAGLGHFRVIGFVF